MDLLTFIASIASPMTVIAGLVLFRKDISAFFTRVTEAGLTGVKAALPNQTASQSPLATEERPQSSSPSQRTNDWGAADAIFRANSGTTQQPGSCRLNFPDAWRRQETLETSGARARVLLRKLPFPKSSRASRARIGPKFLMLCAYIALNRGDVSENCDDFLRWLTSGLSTESSLPPVSAHIGAHVGLAMLDVPISVGGAGRCRGVVIHGGCWDGMAYGRHASMHATDKGQAGVTDRTAVAGHAVTLPAVANVRFAVSHSMAAASLAKPILRASWPRMTAKPLGKRFTSASAQS